MTQIEQPPSNHQITLGGLRLGTLLAISFQRFARPDRDIIVAAPSSLGALPIGAGDSGRLFLPVAPNEAFWIGLAPLSSTAPVQLAVNVQVDGSAVDALSGEAWNPQSRRVVSIPPVGAIDCIQGQRPRAFSSACRLLHFMASRVEDGSAWISASLSIVDYASFEDLTKCKRPSPLDPDAGYKGWRLP